MRTRTIIGGLAISAFAWAGHAEAGTARAEIKDADGKRVGEAVLEDKGDGVQVTTTLYGLPPGTRAFHVHEVGKCEPPFDSAGGHFNPGRKEHGKDNPRGAHAGDLPNVVVAENGQAKIVTTINGVSLDGAKSPLLDADGAALVVHEGADDQKSDPAGNAGKRIACGVIQR
jgi:Cu-Zn family superoxide dismutase